LLTVIPQIGVHDNQCEIQLEHVHCLDSSHGALKIPILRKKNNLQYAMLMHVQRCIIFIRKSNYKTQSWRWSAKTGMPGV